MYSKNVFGFTIIVIPLLLTLNDFTKGYVLIICNLYFVIFFWLNVHVSVCLKQFANDSKIIIITPLRMDFRAHANSTEECLTNFYKDGNDCKGIVLF